MFFSWFAGLEWCYAEGFVAFSSNIFNDENYTFILQLAHESLGNSLLIVLILLISYGQLFLWPK